ncbi:hypothetical protein BDV38DRAFT_244154 [Aspergillus pseudotamarii]|uniref:Uncharacterized protein n=1 Tax=Aspergillus pseudotamarii TaxID=132259 RepID=A0A5N6SY04_ASPPS|nr:uncharacterized protein BDV38DRAFT_244154 [Aspergillus pseudotamarii]KAE8138630.1 hypothetical protein BDV38DRAFT_244154 [Aspergillus pseudotamarii]
MACDPWLELLALSASCPTAMARSKSRTSSRISKRSPRDVARLLRINTRLVRSWMARDASSNKSIASEISCMSSVVSNRSRRRQPRSLR